jgi:5'-nucleotidase/UDP-sugar diphosphatase
VGHNGSRTSNGDIELAKAVPGINVIVGGHSQEVIKAERHGDAIIVQAHEWGKYLGRLDLRISKNSIKMKSYNLIPINKAKKIDGKYTVLAPVIKEDPELLKIFAPYKEKTEKLSLENVAVLDEDLPAVRTEVRTKQVGVGQFMGAALKAKVKSLEVGILNGGSLRSTLKAGNINRKELHKLHPYGNTIVSVKLTKDEFFKYMETIAGHILTARKGPIGGNPQLINIKLVIKNGKLHSVSDRRGSWKLVKRGNSIIGNKKTITLGTLNFLARGGDNYPDITKHKSYIDTGFMINAAMMDYAIKLKKINANFYKMNIHNLISIE